MPKRPESDLYLPVKRFLEAQGFTVRSEVHACDCMAVRGDEVAIVELKTSFNLSLVMQGIDRQTLAENVYLAVEAPRGRKTRAQRDDMRRLCGRLGLGLLFVHFNTEGRPPFVEVIRDCSVSEPRRSKRRHAALLHEFSGRSGDYNTGGSARRNGRQGQPIITAYREEALRVARYLQLHGPTRLRDIRNALASNKVNTIIDKNYYGWFTRVERGVYALTPDGVNGLAAYTEVVAQHEASYQDKSV